MSNCPFGGGGNGNGSGSGQCITYGSALNIGALLRLQQPFSPEPHHDELQYVIIHQTSELWFKLLLHELDEVGAELSGGDLDRAARLLRRATAIVGLIDQGFSLMESMTAYDYAAFRPMLTGGSGFQSAQFRELELALSCCREATLDQPAFTAEERDRFAARRQRPNLWDAFVAAMRRHGYAMPARADGQPDLAARALHSMYATGAHPALRQVSEEMAALDNAIGRWRYHHAIMAERAIGMKEGTGGEGVEYLYRTARTRAFPELMALRTAL